jgi:hypothetical protein
MEFNKIIVEFGLVRDSQKYFLKHPKLNWALEATPQSPIIVLRFKPIEL